MPGIWKVESFMLSMAMYFITVYDRRRVLIDYCRCYVLEQIFRNLIFFFIREIMR